MYEDVKLKFFFRRADWQRIGDEIQFEVGRQCWIHVVPCKGGEYVRLEVKAYSCDVAKVVGSVLGKTKKIGEVPTMRLDKIEEC